MKVFADLHHSDLYHSLYLLFVKRLGFDLYRPIGLEWFHQGFWKIAAPYNNAIETVNQYLAIANTGWDQYTNLNGNHYFQDDIYYVFDHGHDYYQKAITLPQFRDTQFDIIIASIPSHIGPYQRLVQKFQPKAKMIFQIGNPNWNSNISRVNNILCSTAPFNVPNNTNIVFYHQELDPDFFKYELPVNHKRVHSYVHYMKKMDRLASYQKHLQDWQFMTYGAGMTKSLRGAKKVAEEMIRAGWTWHYKPRGDGFGHVIHGSYACGRPTIVDSSPYQNQSGGLLLEDKITCIDISKRSVQENIKLLREFADPEKHLKLCRNSYKRFRDVVNYDVEEQQIRKFIERLV